MKMRLKPDLSGGWIHDATTEAESKCLFAFKSVDFERSPVVVAQPAG
jgi:hypothetical protein